MLHVCVFDSNLIMLHCLSVAAVMVEFLHLNTRHSCFIYAFVDKCTLVQLSSFNGTIHIYNSTPYLLCVCVLFSIPLHISLY